MSAPTPCIELSLWDRVQDLERQESGEVVTESTDGSITVRWDCGDYADFDSEDLLWKEAQ